MINEIHYDPPAKNEPAEFVEIHNPGPAALNLGGWSLSGGIDYTFPAGTTIPAAGYLVAAQDPGWVSGRWGVAAVGPWTGRLRNENERVELRDPAGEVIDEVTFQLGFPWPTVGTAPGLSIELVHPGLDNDLGGNWRPSVAGSAGGATTSRLIEAGSEWRFFRGRTEASTPTTAWREADFADGGWETGRLPLGYDPALPLATELGDMRGAYTSVFLRREFTVSEAGLVSALEVAALYDDGFRVWVNGQLILNVNLATGELAYHATAGPARESNDYETFEVALPPGVLREGRNVLAVQAHNASLNGSSDFFFDAQVLGVQGPTGQGPTPGARNVVYSETAPPAIRQVDHSPKRPRTGEEVVISAKVTDPDGVGEVTLAYQVVVPGDYVEITDARYETEWNQVPMRDDGQGVDAEAGDGVYSATVPGSVQQHRRLIRYRVLAADAAGTSVRAPYVDDPQPNFAYFVYDGVPAWVGAVRPGAAGDPGRTFTVAAEEMNRLPVIHLLARRSTVEEATWFSRYGGDAYPWVGTLVVDGEVYDHIHYRARGGVWRYAMTKNMWKFDFNRGHDLEVRDEWGRKLPVRWTKLNLGASIQQGDYNHRGEQGMFESLGFRIFRIAGVPAMQTAFAQFRVIDAPAEVDPADQYEGDFWGVYLMMEQPDGRFLDQHDRPDGNFYKMEGGGGELNNLGPAGPADGSDLSAFLRDYNGATETWWRQNFEVASYLSYQTVVQAIHHYDICYDKNFFYYRNPETTRWEVVPWDLDLTWAENMYDAGCGGVDRIKQRILSNSSSYPAIWREWQGRIREFRDLFWNADEAGRLIDEYAGRLRGPAAGPTILDADRAQWDYNPKMTDRTYSTSPNGKAGVGRFYQWPNYSAAEVSRDFDGCVQLLKRYVDFRGANGSARPQPLDQIAQDPQIPARPGLEYAGPDGFPVDGLHFRCSSYAGARPQAVTRWRVGEITRPTEGSWASAEPWRYEIEAVWESGTQAGYQAEVQVPVEALRVGAVYRARVQFEDVDGRTSRWSEPVEFVASAAESSEALASGLRLTELMFHAADGAEWDFLELQNAGSVTLDLGGSEFTDGISYTFPAGATLEPGAYLVLSRADPTLNFAAFRAHYGLDTGVRILGPYDGNLSDGGERVILSAPGGGSELLRVTYSDDRGWPLAADGAGHSLVPVRDFPPESRGALDYAGNWRASRDIGGSPGAPDPEPTETLVLNEIVAHTDFLSEFDSNDWIELYQRDTVPFTFDGDWYLSDDSDDLKQWRIPAGLQVPPLGWITFDEVTGFNQPAGAGFGLDKGGDQIFLSHLPASGPGRVVDAISFRGQENDWSLARVPDGGAYWDQVIPRTRDGANAAILPRVVLSEILYHEDGLPTNQLDGASIEFLELHNPTAQPVRLYNTNAVWRLNGGVEFDLPLFLTLAADERIVLVSFDPQADPTRLAGFRGTFGLAASVRVFGPYNGRLDNDTDRIALERAQAPDVPGDPITWVVVDEVRYFDRDPWPPEADGLGYSLQRRAVDRPGNDPATWFAATPNPGSGITEPDDDQDDDAMPDAWEREYGLDPSDPADAVEDADGDGARNRDEYLSGTNPRDATSVLRVEAVEVDESGALRFVFQATAGRTYVVETSPTARSGTWSVIQTVGPFAADQAVMITVPLASGQPQAFQRVRLL